MVNDSHTLVSPQPHPSQFASTDPFGNTHPSGETKAQPTREATWMDGSELDE